MDETNGVVWFLLVIIVIGVLCGGLYGCPKYNVYSQKLAGEAELA